MSCIEKELSKKLGFGCMRLPVLNGKAEEIDEKAFCAMIDTFIEQGFAYFDTAYPYHNEKSEEMVRRCLVERYGREQFFLADKMPIWLVDRYEDYQKIFDTQLERCGVAYFDFYLLHALTKERYALVTENKGFAFAQKMKEEGKIRHLGFSFHDSANVLDTILSEHLEVEFVQLQINYYDWDSEIVQSRKCYETAVQHGVSVIVMEPVKGGTLADIAGEPAKILKELEEKASFASYAIRYAASLEHVVMVLSGMSNQEQLMDNISYMKELVPLLGRERQAIKKTVEELNRLPLIPCTKCRYCVEGCPKKIMIPDLFEDYNMVVQFGMTEANRGRYRIHTAEHGKADECIHCGRCESQCPQHLEIKELIDKVAAVF